ncbi:IS30 family transposase [Catenuloplanes nepalensis]|uniref:IS30 family transposase n=2 Tax=Catenuloplanes nepalensis TaxID=587533 RepID=A0ABT9MR59_9ACTN|nr:IS30 family transposase [Catenuloplanes nepalensis]MDP9792290.1 IS30 family transposase [Catenuloplanes nepalensis]MDP9793786.1 IS30 family transposase [Catenuloplanes nepalensis]MDP9795052.1 IS30 family transposase [Catenuloplanes nepalensis]MDP9796698.1 IS30 family transposase [Catenuloplanes nepalensis]MDP9796900.1 IS30 family transposase [Catenuloplanes nepalensis]
MRWFQDAGGVINNGAGAGSGRYLSFEEREEIMLRRDRGESRRSIAVALGREPSTIGRELARNSTVRVGYRAGRADEKARDRRRRPKPVKLADCPRLRRVVQGKLKLKWSPRQIALWLPRRFPDDESMRVSHETIYQSLFVQSRGGLRKELTACLRTGRALRKPRVRSRQQEKRGRIPAMINIRERPAEAADRAVPGHWEGDLIIGEDGGSAIGTLVERSTRYCMLVHLPDGRDAEAVRDALIATITTLPAHLTKSLTWDQGVEMTRHADFTIATGIDVYFCDPHSPWQRGSNENTNGLLRQYFPKGTDLSVHTRQHLDDVAAELNGRPRETLNMRTPAEALNQLLSAPLAA